MTRESSAYSNTGIYFEICPGWGRGDWKTYEEADARKASRHHLQPFAPCTRTLAWGHCPWHSVTPHGTASCLEPALPALFLRALFFVCCL